MATSVLKPVRHGRSFIPAACSLVLQHSVRWSSNKHFNPKFRKLRRRALPGTVVDDMLRLNLDDKINLKDEDYVREQMKILGMHPRQNNQQPIDLTCTKVIVEPYVPPEGDGKTSLLSKEKLQETSQSTVSKGKDYMATRKLKQFDETFSKNTFPDIALGILIRMYTLLQDLKKNQRELHKVVTTQVYPRVTHDMWNKTFRWKFIESLEPARIVQIRNNSLLEDTAQYTQITVRFHTKQMLALYDRFGRLMCGSETIPRDVIEYIVFEKHIQDVYGEWRIHGKILPESQPSLMPVMKTFVKTTIPDYKEEEDDKEESVKEKKKGKKRDRR